MDVVIITSMSSKALIGIFNLYNTAIAAKERIYFFIKIGFRGRNSLIKYDLFSKNTKINS